MIRIVSRKSFFYGKGLSPRFLSSVDNDGIPIPTVTTVNNSIKIDKPQNAREWHKWFQNLPPLDAERELHKLKRTIGALHSKGDYHGALDAAKKLEATVLDEMGSNNAVYASCLNNVALMHKMLGEDEVAVDTYTKALHIYEDVTGKNHASYASTLSNIGILYRSMAEKASGMDRLQLIERAEEALSDALATRRSITGSESRESISTAMNLAMLWRVLDSKEAKKRTQECEGSLKQCLELSTSQFGVHDALTATILSNYGLFLKEQSRFEEARSVYESSVEARSATLGDTHPDTIVSMHNLAECLLSMGHEAESVALQEKILRTMGNVVEEVHGGQDLRTSTSASEERPSPSQTNDELRSNNLDSEAIIENEEKDQLPTKPIVTYATRPKRKK